MYERLCLFSCNNATDSNLEKDNMTKQATAYDYDTQKWVIGEEGGQLRLKQLNDELTLLQDPVDGAEYARFAGTIYIANTFTFQPV